MEIDRNGLEVLDRTECLRLLGRAVIGRLGLTVGALPTVLPVNYRLIDDKVYFRSSVGSKLQAAVSNAVVAFEVDDMDPLTHTGWSVVVTGIARQVADPDELQVLEAAHIPTWAPLGDTSVVEVSTEMLSGRRIAPATSRVLAPEPEPAERPAEIAVAAGRHRLSNRHRVDFR